MANDSGLPGPPAPTYSLPFNGSERLVGSQNNQRADFAASDLAAYFNAANISAPDTLARSRLLNIRRGVSIESKGGGVGESDTTNSRAFRDAKFEAEQYQTGVSFANPTGSYAFAEPLDCRDTIAGSRNFKGLVGPAMYGADIVMTGNNTPIIIAAGQDKRFTNLGLRYQTIQSFSNTSAIAFQVVDYLSFSDVISVRAENAFRGFDTRDLNGNFTQGAFSCRFDDIRCRDSADDNVLGSDARGSGNYYGRLYASAQGRDRTNRLLTINGNIVGEACQVNCEQAAVMTSALRLNGSDAFLIAALTMEQVRLFDADSFLGLVESSALYPSILKYAASFIHVGGYIVTSAVKQTGNQVLLTLDGQEEYASAFAGGGPGLRVGEAGVIDGYNGAPKADFTVVSVPNKTQLLVDSAALAGSDLTLESGAECVALWKGAGANRASPKYPDVSLAGKAQGLEIGTYNPRSLIYYGKNSAARAGLPAHLINRGSAGRLEKTRVIQRGRSNGVWQQDNPIVAVWRISNVAYYLFQRRHYLQNGDIFRVTAGTLASGFPGFATVLDASQDYVVTVASSGADVPVTRQTGVTAAYAVAPSVSFARSANVATVVLGAALDVARGERMRVYSAALAGSGFNVSEARIISATKDAATTTLTYRNPGADVATTADTTAAVQIIHRFPNVVGSVISPSTAFQAVVDLDGAFSAAFATVGETVPAGSLGTVSTVAVIGVRPGDRIDTSLVGAASLPVGLRLRVSCDASDTITYVWENVSAASVIAPATWGTAAAVRK